MVSCHVERLLDDRVYARYRRFAAARPSGFSIASLVRPPDPVAGEDPDEWARRARELASYGPIGHHTHWGGPTEARPTDDGAAARVLAEAAAFEAAGIAPRFFCGGGWYMDAEVAGAAADLGYVDCSATSYRQAYLAAGAARVQVQEPSWLRLADGRRLLELPATRSVGMLLRALGRYGEPAVHVHFHDWDVVDPRRRLALAVGLRVLRSVRRPLDLSALAESVAETAPEVDFAQVAGG